MPITRGRQKPIASSTGVNESNGQMTGVPIFFINLRRWEMSASFF
jgi:hypothetical protein